MFTTGAQSCGVGWRIELAAEEYAVPAAAVRHSAIEWVGKVAVSSSWEQW